jgi:glycosyltransferase involved in cell wall biosynthesis
VKTGRGPLSVVQVNFAWDKSLADPDQLLDRYATLTGWSDALAAAGAAPVTVVQRFHRDAQIRRGGVEYLFRRGGLAAAVAGARPDVAHVNGLEFAARTWLLRRALAPSAAIVVQSHGDGGAVGRAPALRLAARATRRAADAFLFAAAEHADPWRQAGVIAPDQPVHCVMPASSTLHPFDPAQGRPFDPAQGRPFDAAQGKPFDDAQGFDATQGRPFDDAQGRPFDAAEFDPAQGRPFDAAQGRPFDVAQGRPFDPAQGRLADRIAARHASGLRGSPALLWVGRLTANKDPLTVLDAFERCAPELPGATLTMIHGTDELIAPVRARLAQSAALRDRVRLLGAVPHDRIAAFFTAADIFVVGSHHEGSGYSLMEACACGAIPVVTDIPTFRLITAGGAVGALWTVGDAASCARGLVDAARRDLAAERAKLADHFARELSWSAVGNRAMQIYDRVLDTRRSGPGAATRGSGLGARDSGLGTRDSGLGTLGARD